ncbi:MAG: ExeM/NucH family extracellular endonuclease [Gammaproteobacteria bacterium]|nr:ExeM/NucH family extracellular endonuclease [Gammaproteobacteria bacterium]MDH5729229.1 ExeM/NucH family extracellular endonuclease [Gammaproteobacteria bacterium]
MFTNARCFYLQLLLATFTFSSSVLAQSNDLLITEYVEGSALNKAVEIFNGTGVEVDLSTYELQFYFNGNLSAARTITLQGFLSGGDAFVITQEAAEPALRDLADQLDTSTTWFNGDDAVVLLKAGVIIDSLGQIGVDPGSQWLSGNVGTQNNTLRRKADVCVGDVDAYNNFDPALQWIAFGQDVFDDLGTHSVNCSGELEPPTIPQVFIHDIQGETNISPLLGQTVTIQAVVVGDFQTSTQLNGFFVQEEDSDVDYSDTTSEGIFVYHSSDDGDVQVGDLVEVSGIVAEYFGLTELTSVDVNVISQNNPLPTAANLTLPMNNVASFEAYESMLVEFSQRLIVTENYDLGRFGELWLSANNRLMIPSNIVSPGATAINQQIDNDLNRILLDDGSSVRYAETIRYPNPGLSATHSLRIGDSINQTSGVLHYAFNQYRIQPTQTLSFVTSNPRSSLPDYVAGRIKIASFNVLNYFNGDGIGGGFPTSRGADSLEEFTRQRDKIIAAISAMDADIVGLMEIENDGYAANSAIADLVNGLNAYAGNNRAFDYINPGVGRIGSDEITVGLIYRPKRIQPIGAAAILDSTVNANFNDLKNRPTLAQTFERIRNRGRITLAVNHFKSKGSNCDSIGDPDIGDAQGNCNLTRTQAAQALVQWLSTDPTHSGDDDFLIIGDLNSYAKEDPITAIKTAGYVDLIDHFIGAETAYSYVFRGQSGYLDHALASSSLLPQIRGATIWHINADEPHVLDYNTELKTTTQIDSLYANNVYRASDHDPVIIGMDVQRPQMFISDLDAKAKRLTNSNWYATVNVTVVDQWQQPLRHAFVKALWIGNNKKIRAYCKTNALGQCKLRRRVSYSQQQLELHIRKIRHRFFTYESSKNIDIDGDSNGSTIRIARPDV